MAKNYRVNIHQARLTIKVNRITERHCAEMLREVLFESRARASGGPYSKGALAASIHQVGPITLRLESTGIVEATSPHARMVHDGTGLYGPKHQAYDIFPKAAAHVYRFGSRRKPQLRFEWRGKIRYFPHIPGAAHTIGRSHPGQRGKNYLVGALEDVAHRRGARVKYN